MTASPEFFAVVRGSLFGGRLTAAQVDGLNRIVGYGIENGYSRPDLAYVLATVHHETGRRMQPIREGFASTDAGARRAVAGLKAKGIISTDYSLPTGPHKQSYYGRGLVQITWYENYLKYEKRFGYPLTEHPDLALEWAYALQILFVGMRDGLFTKYDLDEVPDYMTSPQFDRTDRLIINGDAKKNGDMIAAYAAQYWKALETDYGRAVGQNIKDVQAGGSILDARIPAWLARLGRG